MGIKGLLPLLEAAKERVELVEQRFFGCRVAIDGDGLLYKAAYSCAQELALGQETDRHVRYVIDTVMKMQVMWHLTPIVVFDGEGIPIKYETQEKRRVEREQRRRTAAMHMLEGREDEANEMLMRCISISGRVKQEAISGLSSIGVKYLIAPYEADSQLAYMSRCGEIDYVISEDSDMLLYGCERVLFKMNYKSGHAELVTKDRLLKCVSQWFHIHDSQQQIDYNEKKGAIRLFQLFRWTCVLSGCDYLASLPGIGLAKARRLVMECVHNSDAITTENDALCLKRMFTLMPAVLGVCAPHDYVIRFGHALATYESQPVFNLNTEECEENNQMIVDTLVYK